MKKLLAIVVLLSIPSAVFAQRRVRGYHRQNGTYVQPHERSAPNAYRWDNTNYQPSHPAYNPSYYQPTRNYGPSHYQPNPNRFNDSNPYNNQAPAFNPPQPRGGLFN